MLGPAVTACCRRPFSFLDPTRQPGSGIPPYLPSGGAAFLLDTRPPIAYHQPVMSFGIVPRPIRLSSTETATRANDGLNGPLTT